MGTSDYYILDNSDIEVRKLEAAKGLYQSGNFSGALKLYLDMVNTSFSYKLYYDIGRCYYKMNDFQLAENYFLKSVNLEEYKNPSYQFLGNIYHKRQDLVKAIEYWMVSFSYKPDDENVCLNLASSYFIKEMKFQSMFFYEKYLKYAKNKDSNFYLEIKKNIEQLKNTGRDFYQKALKALKMDDKETAKQALEFAVKNYPLNFDINYTLAKIYLEENLYMQSMIYFKQAWCIDSKSLDVLERLSSVLLNIGDFTGAYCCLKRILPLIINNQKEYLKIIKELRELENSFDNLSYQGHEQLANLYYNENNYQLALFEFENCVIIDGKLADKLDNIILKINSYLKPEERIIKLCFEKGMVFYSAKDYRQANKYFSKILSLSESTSSDYKLAKGRMMNV